MLFELICLNWFDAISVTGTFLAVLVVQLINANYDLEKLITTTTSKKAITATATSTATLTKAKSVETTAQNGQLRKQKSDVNEDSISSSTPTTEIPTTPTNARHSISSLSNINIIPTNPVLISSDSTISDDYHEDEDTLSLDNLFPCDQTEIYASKKISFIIDELIQTEMNYVNNLRKGLQMYGKLHERKDLPEALQGEANQRILLGNVDEILEVHEKQILPLMLRNQRDLKALFDEFAANIDKETFYAYVIFMLNKKTSMQLRQEQREWFQNLQNEIKDKLGIDSFLVQPVQRLTRYPLLLQQFISEFYKSGISCKPVLTSVCKLETRVRRMLDVVNQAEQIPSIEDINEFNIENQGRFRRSTEFELYHYRTRKKYRSKVFLFDQCLLCTEVRKKRLVYRQHLPWESIELQLNNSKSITVLQKPTASHKMTNGIGIVSAGSTSSDSSSNGREELELSAPEAISVTNWIRCARKIVETTRIDAQQHSRFSLPMDLVLGVALAIWLIWHYLY